MDDGAMERCCGCGGYFRTARGSTHPYMLSSPGCWEAYGELLAREYGDQALFQICHCLTVDAYAVQHPGDAVDPRASRSVWLHAASLCAIFDDGLSNDQATALLQRLAGQGVPAIVRQDPPEWTVTVADVARADLAEHADAVRQWARSVHDEWRIAGR